MFSGGELGRYASRALWRILWLVIVVCLVLGFVVGYASAQEHNQMQHSPTDPAHWYDGECCSLNDCIPLAESDYVISRGIMHILSTGEQIPLNNIRPSMDTQAHRCYNPLGKTRMANGRWCVYLPPST